MIGPQNVPTEWTSRIANLIHTLRPDWDQRGIETQLRKVCDRPLGTVALAAISAALERIDQRTPTVIAADGPHWRIGTAKPTEQPPSAQRCPHNVVGYCDACNGPLPSLERIREIRAEFFHPKNPYQPDPTSVVIRGEVTKVTDLTDDDLPF